MTRTGAAGHGCPDSGWPGWVLAVTVRRRAPRRARADSASPSPWHAGARRPGAGPGPGTQSGSGPSASASAGGIRVGQPLPAGAAWQSRCQPQPPAPAAAGGGGGCGCGLRAESGPAGAVASESSRRLSRTVTVPRWAGLGARRHAGPRWLPQARSKGRRAGRKEN